MSCEADFPDHIFHCKFEFDYCFLRAIFVVCVSDVPQGFEAVASVFSTRLPNPPMAVYEAGTSNVRLHEWRVSSSTAAKRTKGCKGQRLRVLAL